MATDVSFLSRILNGGDRKDSGEPTALITRDLLGGRFTILDSKELDLDVHVPSGWEKRLDLKSGKVYIHRCDSMNSSSEDNIKVNDTASKLQDLNFPASAKQPLNSNMSEETNLNLKLVLSPSATPAPSPPASSSTFYSVCTLDKVKSALERAEREEAKKRRSVSIMSSSSHSHSSSSVKVSDQLMEEEEEEKSSSSSSAMYAASCPNCLLYVLVFKNNPKCPRCQVTVPSPIALKKPRIDLNISL